MKHAHGFDALDRKFARLIAALPRDRKVEAALAGGAVIRDEARQLAPERSGRLRANIQSLDAGGVTLSGGRAPQDMVVVVGPVGSTPDGDVPYAYEVEIGDRYWPGIPYMRPAVAAKRDAAIDVVASRLRDFVADSIR